MGTGGRAAATATLALALLGAGCSDGSAWDEGCDGSCGEDGSIFVDLVVGVLVGVGGGDHDRDPDGGRPAPPPLLAVGSDLLRDADSPDPDGRGRVRVRASRRREVLLVGADRLDPWAPVEFLVEGPSGELESLGFRVADPAGRAALGLASEGWRGLPGGAPTLADLGGRRVALRDGGGRTLLRGRVPGLRTPRGRRVARDREFDPASGVEVRVALRVDLRRGRQRFDLRAGGLAPGEEVVVLVADTAGLPTEALRGAADGRGRVAFRAESRTGEPMPLGVLDLPALSGRRYEVRSAGEPVLAGLLPSFRGPPFPGTGGGDPR